MGEGLEVRPSCVHLRHSKACGCAVLESKARSWIGLEKEKGSRCEVLGGDPD